MFLFVLFLVNKALKRYLVSFGKLSGLYRFVFLPLLKNGEEPQEMNEREVTKAPPGASDLETLWLMVGILTPNKRNCYSHPPVSFNCLSRLEELRLIQSVRGWRSQQHMTKICFFNQLCELQFVAFKNTTMRYCRNRQLTENADIEESCDERKFILKLCLAAEGHRCEMKIPKSHREKIRGIRI